MFSFCVDTTRKESNDIDTHWFGQNKISLPGTQNARSNSLDQRSKRWQYTDPLAACMGGKCQGLEAEVFYTCVYTKCISAGLRPGSEAEER